MCGWLTGVWCYWLSDVWLIDRCMMLLTQWCVTDSHWQVYDATDSVMCGWLTGVWCYWLSDVWLIDRCMMPLTQWGRDARWSLISSQLRTASRRFLWSRSALMLLSSRLTFELVMRSMELHLCVLWDNCSYILVIRHTSPELITFTGQSDDVIRTSWQATATVHHSYHLHCLTSNQLCGLVYSI